MRRLIVIIACLVLALGPVASLDTPLALLHDEQDLSMTYSHVTNEYPVMWDASRLEGLELHGQPGHSNNRPPADLNNWPDSTIMEWDDADSHKWIGEPWGDNVDVECGVEIDDRKTLKVEIANRGVRWALIRTDAFPSENWETFIGLRADIYVSGISFGLDVEFEVRGCRFDPPDLIETIYCYNLHPGWNTCTWFFRTARDYSDVTYVSMVFEDYGATSPTLYIDNLRLVTDDGECEWDDMDDCSHWWVYGGDWVDWSCPQRIFGLEPITHNHADLATCPSGAVYLQWDYIQGSNLNQEETFAEVGTSLETIFGSNELNEDWSGYNRISADVRISDADVPISVFLWDNDRRMGFGTPVRFIKEADTWQTLVWDLPWPPQFDPSNVDQVKFVVNDINEHPTGVLYIDNIRLIADVQPDPVSGLSYIFEDHNDYSLDFNDFSGNWGELDGEHITRTFDSKVYCGSDGGSLKLEYDLPMGAFTGIWHSLWGRSDYREYALDFTDIYGDLAGEDKDFEQIQFWVRGSGLTNNVYNVKAELKDNRDSDERYEYSALRYFIINDSDTSWHRVVLDADVTNADCPFWSYNRFEPDLTRMKELVFVIESSFNPPSGTVWIDDIVFVDADDAPFELDEHSDDEFLNLVSRQTFLYCLDWYDHDNGLIHDRSTFPNLMSTAATGFCLTAFTIGDERGWIENDLAKVRVEQILSTLWEGLQGTDQEGTIGYKGFFYHFLDDAGLRKVERDDEGNFTDGSELSSVDTALLMAGVLTVKEHFAENPAIVNLADNLYRRVDWPWMVCCTTSDHPDEGRFYLGWKPEPECDEDYQIPAPGGGCFSGTLAEPATWDYYTDEAILINLLAIGSPTHPVPSDVFYAWRRQWGTYAGHTVIQSWTGSLFTYIFAHLYVDFQQRGPDRDPDTPVDWWENTYKAAWTNWQFAMDYQDDAPCDGDDRYTTYSSESWGLTACEGPPPPRSLVPGAPPSLYHAYGTPPAGSDNLLTPEFEIEQDGTIAPYGAAMAISFLSDESIAALKHYFANPDLWRYRFGFADAYNLDPPMCNDAWYHHVAFGIDQGPMLLALENYRDRLVWDTLAKNDYLRSALCQIFCTPAGFRIYLPIITKDRTEL